MNEFPSIARRIITWVVFGLLTASASFYLGVNFEKHEVASSRVSASRLDSGIANSQTYATNQSWVPQGYSTNDTAGVAYEWQTSGQNPDLNAKWCGAFSGDSYCKFLAVKVNATCIPKISLQLEDANGNVQDTITSGDGHVSDPVTLLQGQQTIIAFNISGKYPRTNLLGITC